MEMLLPEMVIIPKIQPWKSIFFFLLTLVVFFFLLLLVVFYSSHSETQKMKETLDYISRKVGENKGFRHPIHEIEQVAHYLFGPITEVLVFTPKNQFVHLLDSLPWSFSERHIKDELLTRISELSSIQSQWRLSQPDLLSIIVPKILQKTLQDPSFMEDAGIIFHRENPRFRNMDKSTIFYRTLKISSSTYAPVSFEPKTQLLHDIYTTYLYASISKEHSAKHYDLPSSFGPAVSVLLLYISEIQCLISVDVSPPSFFSFLINNLVDVLLCFWGALAVTLLIRYFPVGFFRRKSG